MNRSILVGTRIGVIAQRLRERIELFTFASSQIESIGTVGNDLISRLILESICTPGKVFIDVGAHIGSVIDGVKRHSKPSTIIAIEAIPAKAEALRKRFPQVIVHECAAGEQEGNLPFFIDVDQSGYSSLYPSKGGGKLKQICVQVRRLDDLVNVRPVDVIKIDVEGAELAVLRGAEAIVGRDRPTIIFESGPSEVGNYSKVGIWEWLDRADYAVLLPNRVAHNDPGLSCEGFVEAHLYPRRTTNYIAVPRTRRNEIRVQARLIQGFD